MESLRGLALALNLPPKVRENLALFLWIKSVWPQIFQGKEDKIWPLTIENGVLLIGSSDHYELQTLQSNYLAIFQKLKELYPDAERFPIRSLKFLFRPVREGTDRKERRFGQRRVKASREDWQKLIEFCKGIPDQELSTLFQRTLKNYYNLIT